MAKLNKLLGGGLEELKQKFSGVEEKQGFLGKFWNGFKNLTGLGLGSNDVKEKISQYENGEISYDEALKSIEQFELKQEGATDIIANTASGLVATGITIATGGIGIGLGAAVGGVTKAGLKTADRATNEVEGDALDAKQIAKDSITGAVDGAISVATAGIIKAPIAGQTVKQAVKSGVIQGAKAGAISGAATGAATYTTEAAFEEDVKFSFGGLAKSTVQNAATGAVFGGALGGVTKGIQQKKLNASALVDNNPNVNVNEMSNEATQSKSARVVDAIEEEKQYARLYEKAEKELAESGKTADYETVRDKILEYYKLEGANTDVLDEFKKHPTYQKILNNEPIELAEWNLLSKKVYSGELNQYEAMLLAKDTENLNLKPFAGDVVSEHHNANKVLGDLRNQGYNSLPAEQKELVDLIDNSFETLRPTDTDGMYYRGINLRKDGLSLKITKDYINMLKNAQPGDVIPEAAYSYATPDASLAAKWASNDAYSEGLMIGIETPKGSKISRTMDGVRSEALYPRNAQYEVVEGYHIDDMTGKPTMLLRYLLPQE